MPFGLLNVNKPAGPTSHDIVAAVRRGTGERRVGHVGTLDPAAGGVLVLALGQATRLVEYLMASRKEYLAHITLGIVTDTHDTQGKVIATYPLPAGLSRDQVESALSCFVGEIEQTPPVFSAVKVGGRSAHYRARAGEQVQLKPRRVMIEALEPVDFDLPHLWLKVRCSAGTYIRSLARDLGGMLGCGAVLSGLTRTSSGQFHLEDAVEWDKLAEGFADGSWREHLLPADRALDGTPQVRLDEEMTRLVLNGRLLCAPNVRDGLARAYAPDGRFVAVLRGDRTRGVWQPCKVFAPDSD